MRRNLAFGIGLVAISLAWISLHLTLPVFDIPNGTLVGDINFFFFLYVPAQLYFYWADASVLASRNTDPLRRNTLHWSRMRLAIWALLLGSDVLFVIDQVLYTDVILGGGTGILSTLTAVLGIFIPFVVSPVLLVISWRRSREPTFRAHLKWFAFFAISLGLGPLAAIFIFAPLWAIGWAIGGYCLYRSARSLVVITPSPASTTTFASSNPSS